MIISMNIRRQCGEHIISSSENLQKRGTITQGFVLGADHKDGTLGELATLLCVTSWRGTKCHAVAQGARSVVRVESQHTIPHNRSCGELCLLTSSVGPQIWCGEEAFHT